MSATDPGRSERAAELERRIELLESQRDEEFGAFTRWDWIVCVIGAVALPLVIAIWFAG